MTFIYYYVFAINVIKTAFSTRLFLSLPRRLNYTAFGLKLQQYSTIGICILHFVFACVCCEKWLLQKGIRKVFFHVAG